MSIFSSERLNSIIRNKEAFKEELRAFLKALDGNGKLRIVKGAHWDLEIGTINELMAEKQGPALLFVPVPPVAAEDGPVKENVLKGNEGKVMGNRQTLPCGHLLWS